MFRAFQIHLELRNPVVVPFLIDEDLLHFPGASVLGPRDVRMPQVPRFRIEARTVMIRAIQLEQRFEAV